MSALPAVGSLVFLLVAGVIVGYWRLRELDEAKPAEFKVSLEAADWTVDAAIREDEEIAHFERLFFEVPDSTGVLWRS